MPRYGYSRFIGSVCISALIGVSASSCSSQEEADASMLSDTEITLSLPEWTPIVESRATLFESGNDLLDKTTGGGNFTLYAYMASTAKTYIDDVRAWYFYDTGKWYMLDDNLQTKTYYWPNTDKLNFFAYMPDNRYNGSDDGMYKSYDTHVTVLPYSKEKGQQFECSLPAIAGDGQSKTQEFIYAYETGKNKLDNPLILHFHHPFAMVNFKLKKGSYRMTIDDFTFDKIHLNGIFSTGPTGPGEWESTDAGQTFTAKINKRIPNDINYNSNLYLSEWFIVMPQDLNGVTLTMNARHTTEGTGAITGTYTFGDVKWEQGRKYTYVISYGDNKEEIYFGVEVETEWIEGYEHNIDVE